mmetsp:Transcript_15247/g.21214  ORF Transcript_15247/g.21214 Transcript_15247/m.21214 type:complete len:204 (+) Transcript_15247:78-689(+)
MRGAGRFLLAVIVVSSMGTKTEWGVGPIANYIREIKATMDIAKYASLATFSRTSEDINSRIIFPKPTNVTKADKLEKVYFATNKHSRKYKELQPTSIRDSPARVNLLYWDPEGVGYVAIRGAAYICAQDEAYSQYWNGWDFVYPNGPLTEFYTLIRVVPDEIEFASYNRFEVDVGHNRTDWRPLTLIRSDPTAKWSFLPDQEK